MKTMQRCSLMATFVLATGLVASGSLITLAGAACLERNDIASSRPDLEISVVSHVKITSDRVEDVSSIEDWQRSFIKPGMTDQQKALAVWESVVKFRHQDVPPNEYLQNEENVHDPIKTFNVYGYGMCCCAASNVEALARCAGLPARGRIINTHSVPEIFWEGRWHMLDGSLINYFPKPDGQPAGVDEIIGSVKEWYAQNPGFRGSDARLREFMRGGGWKKGPTLLAGSPFYDPNGWLPAATHGWYATMQEYDGSHSGITEYGYSQGYQVNVQLRPGERLTRNWSNKGLHVNQREGGGPGCLVGTTGSGDLRYAPRYGDLAPGRIGNGVLEYDAPLADASFRDAALAADNLAARAEDRQSPALHLRRADQPGLLIVRMPSSYVYLSGRLQLGATIGTGGEIAVLLSDNNGLDWKPVVHLDTPGPQQRSIDLAPSVYRRYDYRLKFVLKGRGTGLDALRILHDVQHSQRALPALAQGENTITFSAGPPEGTVTIEGSLNPDSKGRQLVYTDFHPEVSGLQDPWLRIAASQGSVTFPIATPGDMKRLRFGCCYRARDAADGWEMQLSFDGGKTFRTVERCVGPTPGNCRYVTCSDVPAGTRSALVRWSGTQRNTTCLLNLRIDADYQEPRGGFRPVQITYVWEENGVEKRDAHVFRSHQETYRIHCAARPVMKSLIAELAK
jgi:hypothetical protein